MNDRITTALRACERQMRLALAEGATAADPSRLGQLVRWLADVQRILAESEPTELAQSDSPLVAKSRPGVDEQTTRHQRGSRRFPQFFRERDSLVKVGWSKKERAAYEHKAPKAAVMALAAALSDVASDGRRVAMEKILPTRNSVGGIVPEYQSYVALAWFRELGLVKQHGRQGYTTDPRKELADHVETAWQHLELR